MKRVFFKKNERGFPMKKHLCILLSLLLCTAVVTGTAAGCTGTGASSPPAGSTSTTGAADTSAATTQPTTATTAFSPSQGFSATLTSQSEAGNVYDCYTTLVDADGSYTSDYYHFSITLSPSMSMNPGDTSIYDTAFAGFPGWTDPVDFPPPYKVGAMGLAKTLTPGTTMDELMKQEVLDYNADGNGTATQVGIGSFLDGNDRTSYYQILKLQGDFLAYQYRYYIMLDDVHMITFFLWNTEYDSASDLSRFSAIADSVRENLR